MSSALQIFKQAGLEELLSPTLMGAGIGAAGYGAASYMNNDDPNASTGSKLKGSLASALKGGLLGGAAGAGVGGAKQLYDHMTGPTDAIKDLVSNSKSKLDTDPFGVSHPILAQVGNIGSPSMGSALEGGLAGGAAGAGVTHAMRSAGSAAASHATANPEPSIMERMKNILKSDPSHHNPDKALNAASSLEFARSNMKSTPANKVTNGISNLFSGTDSSRESAIHHLMKMQPESTRGGLGNPSGSQLDQLKGRAQQLMEADHMHVNNPGARSESANRIIERLQHPFRQGAKAYGKGSGIGAAAGAIGVPALQALIRGGTNLGLNAAYSPEQLKLWNEQAHR